ncbi:MAG: ABC transporter ATP-binding protein [Candidatus Rokubacteria bacterium]|nr:ABC transporter ATP-binding protein [Candidatus Rokubacteria bacterium]
MSSTNGVVSLTDVAKYYRRGAETVKALDGIDLRVDGTGMVAIVGPSGSGKSTLLHLVGAMDRPTRGEVVVAGRALNALPSSALTRFRRQTVGFVFQTFNLIPNLSALENVTLPMEFNKVGKAERQAQGRRLLEQVGLGHRVTHRPAELSGGEQQRVAIARALANDPPLVLADEPTGNLDTETGQRIYELLKEVARQRTVLVVTHAEPLAQLADRIVHIKDGRLEDLR